MAKEDSCDNVNEHTDELFNDAMHTKDDVEFIVSLSKSIVEQLDIDVRSSGCMSKVIQSHSSCAYIILTMAVFEIIRVRKVNGLVV